MKAFFLDVGLIEYSFRDGHCSECHLMLNYCPPRSPLKKVWLLLMFVRGGIGGVEQSQACVHVHPMMGAQPEPLEAWLQSELWDSSVVRPHVSGSRKAGVH